MLLLLLLGAAGPVGAVERLLYLDTTGDQETVYSWVVEHGPETASITVHKSDLTFVNHCRENGETVAWSRSGVGSGVNATLQDGVLRVFGEFNGQTVNTTKDLEGLPWLQPLSYSLPRIVTDLEQDILFWTIRPDTMEPVKLKAEIKGSQELVVNGEKVVAYRIRVSPPGFLSMFWHGDYWYRKGDCRFLRYEGLSGAPGSDKTMVTLLDEPSGLHNESPSCTPAS